MDCFRAAGIPRIVKYQRLPFNMQFSEAFGFFRLIHCILLSSWMAERIPPSFEVWTQAQANRAIRDRRGGTLVTVDLPIPSFALHRAAAP